MMQFLAGVMLSCGGLLNIVITGGSPGLTASNPGIVKILGGFVFPVGLVMSMNSTFKYVSSSQMRIYRIVLMGLELLTSNMMVRLDCRSFFYTDRPTLSSARFSRWPFTEEPSHGGVSHSTGLLVNLFSGSGHAAMFIYVNCSDIRKSCGKPFLCGYHCQMYASSQTLA